MRSSIERALGSSYTGGDSLLQSSFFIERPSQRFDVVPREFAALARRIQAEGRLDETFVDRLGVPSLPEGDVLGWERRLRGGWEAAE